MKDNIPLTDFINAPWSYLRLHGRNTSAWFDFSSGGADRYNYLYSESEIDLFVRLIEKMASNSERVFVVTNNHYRGKGILMGCSLLLLLFLVLLQDLNLIKQMLFKLYS